MSSPIRSADILNKYYADLPLAREILFEHSRQVTKRALSVARRLASKHSVDMQFIAEAAMLHDIGILETDVAEMGCHGSAPYIMHGVAGRKILETEGLFRHALVCERHIGIGLTAEEIAAQKLPLPKRDMLPVCLEEQIICYADLFYSKSKNKRGKEKSPEQIRKMLSKFGKQKLAVFNQWLELFEPELS
jgi:uncharacterized protein